MHMAYESGILFLKQFPEHYQLLRSRLPDDESACDETDAVQYYEWPQTVESIRDGVLTGPATTGTGERPATEQAVEARGAGQMELTPPRPKRIEGSRGGAMQPSCRACGL